MQNGQRRAVLQYGLHSLWSQTVQRFRGGSLAGLFASRFQPALMNTELRRLLGRSSLAFEVAGNLCCCEQHARRRFRQSGSQGLNRSRLGVNGCGPRGHVVSSSLPNDDPLENDTTSILRYE